MNRRLGIVAVLVALAGGIGAAFVLTNGPSRHAAAPTAPTAARPGQRSSSAARRVRGRHDRPVPVLMYHVLGIPRAGAPYPDLYVKPSDLAGQMRWLSRHGYHAVTLGQVFRYWRRGIALPPKPVVVSFDDGYLSDYAVALPTLRRFGWAGVLNLVVHNIVPGDITAWQVRRLIAAGWEIDAHTVSHADLTGLGAAQLRHEVAGSRATLRRMFGQPVDFFCYPAGRYNDVVVAAVRAAGYLGATTVNPGLARPSEAYTLNRIRVGYGDGVRGLVAKLARAA
jgi:peptidoglycan/xylan/chitin deacetylase (PgdA/CDA1 family)